MCVSFLTKKNNLGKMILISTTFFYRLEIKGVEFESV